MIWTLSGLRLSIQLPSLYLRMLIIKSHGFMISRPEDLSTNAADHKQQSSSNCNTRGTDWNGNLSSRQCTTSCTAGQDTPFHIFHHFMRTPPRLSSYRWTWNPVHKPHGDNWRPHPDKPGLTPAGESDLHLEGTLPFHTARKRTNLLGATALLLTISSFSPSLRQVRVWDLSLPWQLELLTTSTGGGFWS